MIVSLINNDEEKESVLIVIIQEDNLSRMRKADPITLESHALRGVLPVITYPDRFRTMIAYEEDDLELNRLAFSGQTGEILRYITRGFKFKRDEDGTERAFKLNRSSGQR